MENSQRSQARAKVAPVSKSELDRLVLIFAGYSAAVVSLIGTVAVLALR